MRYHAMQCCYVILLCNFVLTFYIIRWPRSTTFFYKSQLFSTNRNFFLQIVTIFYILGTFFYKSQLFSTILQLFSIIHNFFSTNHNFFLQTATFFYKSQLFSTILQLFSIIHNFFLQITTFFCKIATFFHRRNKRVFNLDKRGER